MAITSRTERGPFRLLATLAFFAAVAAHAQVPVGDDGYPVESLGSVDTDSAYAEGMDTESLLSAGELEVLVGPIALYPDDLLAIVLPASTYPLEIVQAARFLEAFENDSTLEPEESWDESVIALLNYPEVVHLLNDDIDWTWQLGEAVISQQADLVAAVEAFRDRAYAAGNLKSDEYQTVSNDEGIIEIVPIEDDIIYVPYYEPERVVVYQPQPVYHYYPRSYPVYYYPYPTGHAFSSGYFWGVTTAFRIGWATDHLHIHHPSYWGHPYYGHSYYGHYYRRPSLTVYNTTYVNNSRHYSNQHHRDGDYWRPRRRSGARQSDYYQRTRTYRVDARDERRSDVRAVNYTTSGNSNRHAGRETDTAANLSANARATRADSTRARSGSRDDRQADRQIEFRDRSQTGSRTTDSEATRRAARNVTRGSDRAGTLANDAAISRETRGNSNPQNNRNAERNPTRVASNGSSNRERSANETVRARTSQRDSSQQRQARETVAPPREQKAARNERQEKSNANRPERSSDSRERNTTERSGRDSQQREKRSARAK